MKRRPPEPDAPGDAPEPSAAATAPTRVFQPASTQGDDASAVDRLLERVLMPEAERLTFAGEVASGGMGRVELVIDRALERRMALKVLHPNLRNRVEPVSWFVREAQITAQLEHPSIAPIHHIGVDREGRLHFTMKLIEGQTFEAWIRQRSDRTGDAETTFQIFEIVGKVSDALAFAHSRGVVHGDVKPLNVMVGQYGEVYLMDWGLARTRATQDPPADDAVTTSIKDPAGSQVTGTPAYMAPEQALGQATDERVDIFAVGALLYFAFSLRAPYAAGSSTESWRLARRGQPTPLQEAAPPGSVPLELARIVSKAMARDPGQRYQSVADLRSDLTRFMRGGEGFPQRWVPAGEHIVREGEAADAAYVLLRGRALIYKTLRGRRKPLREVAPGEVFGEMAILTASPRTASVEALEDCLLTVVSREIFEREVDAMKPWMGAFARTLAARFRELEEATLGTARASIARPTRRRRRPAGKRTEP
jgi:eukaryotic-like serine/threonine-protein kinase